MDAGLTVVHTAAELQAAVAAGARDIEIRSHLNLTSLDRTPTLAPYVEDDPRHGLPAYLMYVDAPTRSIRGNCISPPATENTAVPLKPRQCAVAIGDSMMQFLGGRQWLDNLLFRLQPPTAAGTNLSVVLLELGWNAPRSEADLRAEVPAAEVFFTNITVHGDARAPAQVLTASRGSKALMEG